MTFFKVFTQLNYKIEETKEKYCINMTVFNLKELSQNKIILLNGNNNDKHFISLIDRKLK